MALPTGSSFDRKVCGLDVRSTRWVSQGLGSDIVTARIHIGSLQLLELIRQRRDRSPDIGPDCARRCRLPVIESADPKVYASNWTITYLTGCAACNAVVEGIAHDMQREYWLA